MNKLLVTGSSGLIGSEVVDYFCKEGWQVYGIDNNQRADFLGPSGDTRWNQKRLLENHQNFQHVELDIRDRPGILHCSDLSKMQADFPEWNLTKSLDDIFEEIYKIWQYRL